MLEGRHRQVAIVTGGTAGIGLACVKAFVARGDAVAFMGRDAERLAEVQRGLENAWPGQTVGIAGDVTDRSTREALVAAALDRFGRADILVNNAGGGSQAYRIEDVDDDDLARVVDVNLQAAFAMCRLVVPSMKAQGYGRIINIASVAGRDAGRLSGPHYAAAKAGLIGLGRQLSRDLGSHGITVNTVAPGVIMTERIRAKWQARSAEEQQNLLRDVPVGRFGTPEDVAEAVCFFAREASGYINGACLDVNGGSFRA